MISSVELPFVVYALPGISHLLVIWKSCLDTDIKWECLRRYLSMVIAFGEPWQTGNEYLPRPHTRRLTQTVAELLLKRSNGGSLSFLCESWLDTEVYIRFSTRGETTFFVPLQTSCLRSYAFQCRSKSDPRIRTFALFENAYQSLVSDLQGNTPPC